MPEAPKITLKFGGKHSPADSPAPQAAPQTNGANGTAAAVNGIAHRNPFSGSLSSMARTPSLDQLERARSASGSAPSPTPSNSALVKNEEGARNSPAISTAYNNYRGPSQSVSTPGLSGSGMPPPSTPGLTNLYTQSGYAQSFNHHPQYQNPNPSFDSKWRQPGKSMITHFPQSQFY